MAFAKLSERNLKTLKKKRSRQACLDVVARIEDAGVVVDLTKFPDTIPGFIDGIREYQEKVPVEEPTPPMDDEDKEQLNMTPTEPEEEPEPDVQEEETPTEPEEPKEKEESKEDVQTESEVEPEPEEEKLPPYNPSPDLPDWREIPAHSNEEFVRQTYIRILEREPDSGGQSLYTMYLKSGMPREQVIKAIKRSDEYRKLQKMKARAEKQS